MGRKKNLSKGIFCLEGDWWGNLKRPSSVEPILELLSKLSPYPRYIHRGVGTREEFDYFLKRWSQRTLADYPILYLAFDGFTSTFQDKLFKAFNEKQFQD